MTKTCPICRAAFAPEHSLQKYCSPECAKEADRENRKEANRKFRAETERHYSNTGELNALARAAHVRGVTYGQLTKPVVTVTVPEWARRIGGTQ